MLCFLSLQSKGQSISLNQATPAQLISTQAPIRFSQPQLASSSGLFNICMCIDMKDWSFIAFSPVFKNNRHEVSILQKLCAWFVSMFYCHAIFFGQKLSSVHRIKINDLWQGKITFVWRKQLIGIKCWVSFGVQLLLLKWDKRHLNIIKW